MIVKTSELRHFCDTLMTHLEDSGYETIEITDDYFWDIPYQQMYVPEKKPTELTLGSLTEDWKEIKKIEENDYTVAYVLVWIGNILKNIGYRTPV